MTMLPVQPSDKSSGQQQGMTSARQRLALIKHLNALVPSQFESLVFALDVPKGVLPSNFAAQGDRSATLLQWVTGPTGCGMAILLEILKELAPLPVQDTASPSDVLGINKTIEPLQATSSTPPASPAPQFSTYTPATFTGRTVEIAQLTPLLNGPCRILTILGMTGIGKTTLVERVVAEIMANPDTQPLPYYRFNLDDRSLTPDFASSGAALLRTLGEEPTVDDQKDPANLLGHILHRLSSHPCRVQIDSLERLLQGDEQDGWSEFCDPLWLELLQKFIAGTTCSSQLLLTSQDIPADLDTLASRYPGFWHCQTLHGLNADEQRKLFQKLGLSTDIEQDILARIGAFYDGHPLVLRVIADEICQTPFQGNVAHYWQYYEATFSDTVPSKTNKLARSRLFRRRVRQRVERSLQQLPAPALQMLCTSAVFRRPVPISFWHAMLVNDDAQVAFEALQDRHLVEYVPAADDLSDLLVRQHNLIRSVAYDRLKADSETWHRAQHQAAQLWLMDYNPLPDAPNLETVRGDLEAFEHYCEIGDWETAKTILLDQPIGLQLQTWGKYQEMLACHHRLIGHLQPLDEVVCQRRLGKAYYSLSNYPQAILYHQQSLDSAEVIGDKQGQWKALNDLGNIARTLGQYPKSIKYLQQTLALAKEIDDRNGEGRALGSLGLTYRRLGQYEQAIDLLQQQLTIAQEIGDRSGEGSALGSLGNTYYSLGQHEQAFDFQKQRLKIMREIGYRNGEGNALGDLGLVYYSLGQYEQAIDFQQQYLTIAREIGDRNGEGRALGNLGIAYHFLGQHEKAIDFQQQRLSIAREIGDCFGEGMALGNMGEAFLELAQYQESLTYSQQALEIFHGVSDKLNEAEVLKNLAKGHQSLGEIETAQQYCQQALALAKELRIPLVTECETLWKQLDDEDTVCSPD
ncbi:MAG: tetratricopeptide repeat protein [Cyanobacteria bacterium P01_F01_bin.150]